MNFWNRKLQEWTCTTTVECYKNRHLFRDCPPPAVFLFPCRKLVYIVFPINRLFVFLSASLFNCSLPVISTIIIVQVSLIASMCQSTNHLMRDSYADFCVFNDINSVDLLAFYLQRFSSPSTAPPQWCAGLHGAGCCVCWFAAASYLLLWTRKRERKTSEFQQIFRIILMDVFVVFLQRTF